MKSEIMMNLWSSVDMIKKRSAGFQPANFAQCFDLADEGGVPRSWREAKASHFRFKSQN